MQCSAGIGRPDGDNENVRLSMAASVKRWREAVLSGLPGHPARLLRRSDIGRVVVIAAASRSGSSLLFEILKRSPRFLSADGEHTAHFKINRPEWASGIEESSDRIDPGRMSEESLDGLFRDIVLETGIGGEEDGPGGDGYAARVALRLALQWPDLVRSGGAWTESVSRALADFRAGSRAWDTAEFYGHLLGRLKEHCPSVDSAFYDLPGATWPDPKGSQALLERSGFLEEPPFIVVRPRRRPTADEFRRRPLLLKSTSDAYRLPVLRRLFPRAEIRVIHLTRNPAASINGLYDGWRSGAFFSRRVGPGTVLRIPGYSELGPWAEQWWKFDLPPGWRRCVDAPLERVCGFQWASANRAILEDLGQADRSLGVRFESLLAGGGPRRETLRAIAAFAGLEMDGWIEAASADMPVVMATRPPQAGRWKERSGLIRPVISEPEMKSLSRALGYPPGEEEAWP
ncbi:MAG: sulfotransferase [Candidatus Aminicenantes bacterium]|nr:sulfotransferase [Candidatus Aminicenantes bacterium]